MSAEPAAASGPESPDPLTVIRSREYVAHLVLVAALGVPISAAAFGFLALVHEIESLTYKDLPRALGFDGTPDWWPVPLLALSGLLTGLAIRHLPGTGGHKPAEGFVNSGAPTAAELPGVALAALASLGLGAVLGPEAPLIALGGGLAAYAARLVRPGIAPRAGALVAAAGSFAAVSALLGSPLLGAFLLMEASGLAGMTLGLVLVPGLLSAGIGALFFVGLGSWTGLGTYSLTLPDVPHTPDPTLAEFGWAIALGIVAAFAGLGIKRLSLSVQERVGRRRIAWTVAMGLTVGVLALLYAESTGRNGSEVLYSGQDDLGGLLAGEATYTVGTLLILLVCKALAYSASLSAFRGGPIFPAMFLGAAAGLVFSHLPGLHFVPGFAMGIGAMCVAMLRLPMTSVLLATLLLGAEGVTVMPLVIVSVVVSYVLVLRLERPSAAPHTAPR